MSEEIKKQIKDWISESSYLMEALRKFFIQYPFSTTLFSTSDPLAYQTCPGCGIMTLTLIQTPMLKSQCLSITDGSN